MPTLTGLQKAVIFLITLGAEHSAKIIRSLSEAEIERVTAEMANVHKIPEEMRREVLEEFEQVFQAHELFQTGGLDYAREVLERALGTQKAIEIVSRLVQNASVRPFEFVRKTDPKHLTTFIQGEHPQTIALILAHLTSERAALVLSSLPQEIQPEVAKRIALMGQVNPETIREIEEVLKRKFSSFGTGSATNIGGIKTVVDVLNRVDNGTVKTVLNTLEANEPDLAENIKSQMFVFEDIVQLDDRAIQHILRQVDIKDVAIALKGSSDSVAAKIKKNMSFRAATLLKEDMDYMGPVRLRDVEEAQQKIIKVIRGLAESGEIVIARGGQDELVY